MSTTTTHAASGAGEGESPTDLAARFEAKRENCEKWGSYERASAFAEARDMARAGAAGEAGEGASLSGPRLTDDYWPLRARVWTRTSVEPHEKVLEICGTIDDVGMICRHTQSMAVANADVPGLPERYACECDAPAFAVPPPPAQQGSSSPLTEDEIVKLIVKHWLTAKDTDEETADEIADDIAMISPEDYAACAEVAKAVLHRVAQQGSSSPPLTAEREGLLDEAAALLGVAFKIIKYSEGPQERRIHAVKITDWLTAYRAAQIVPASLTAERVDLGELERLRTVSMKLIGAWDRAPQLPEFMESALAEFEHAWALVPASLPAGTGSADEGTGEPSGTGSREPSPSVSASGFDPSRDDIFGDFDAADYKPDLASAIAAEIMGLKWTHALPASDDIQDEIDAEGEHCNRYGDVQEAVTRVLEHSRVRTHTTRITPALGTEAGTAETERLGPKDDGPAPQGATPAPDPVGEAKALLEGLSPIRSAEEWVNWYRKRADHCPDLLGKASCIDHADEIEAALATIASQDQAGEVRR